MITNDFRDALERATLAQLEQVINWLERPWSAAHNDRLRAAWHEASRRPHRRAALVELLEREILTMPAAARAHVAHGLGHRRPDPTAEDLSRLVTDRLRAGAPPPFNLAPLLDAAMRTAGLLLDAYGASAHRPRHGRRGRRHHGRS